MRRRWSPSTPRAASGPHGFGGRHGIGGQGAKGHRRRDRAAASRSGPSTGSTYLRRPTPRPTSGCPEARVDAAGAKRAVSRPPRGGAAVSPSRCLRTADGFGPYSARFHQLDRGDIPTCAGRRAADERPPDTRRSPFEHEPVMLDEIVDLFGPGAPGDLIDATVGGRPATPCDPRRPPPRAGLGLDRTRRPRGRGRAARPYGGRAGGAPPALRRLDDLGLDEISGVLFDLGVSSPQLDRADRGFSHRYDAPLDMRMDPATGAHGPRRRQRLSGRRADRPAAPYGDERFASRIARAIVAARPLSTTTGRWPRSCGTPSPPPPAAPAATPPSARSRPPGSRSTRSWRSSPHLATRPSTSSPRWPLRRARLPLRRGPHREGAVPPPTPPAGTSPSPACPCPPTSSRPCASSAAAPKTPVQGRSAANPRGESARLRVVEKLLRGGGLMRSPRPRRPGRR